MRRYLVLAAVAVALTGCGSDEDEEESGATGTPIKTITISETDFALDPKSVSLEKPGTYAFEVVNEGEVGHALEVEGEGIEKETETLDPGQRATLTVELEAGSYELYCPVGDHADRGMKGEVAVRASGAPTPTDTTDSSESDY